MTDTTQDTEKEAPRLPLHLRTPITEAGAVVSHLAEIWSELVAGKGGSSGGADSYIEKVFGEMFRDEQTSGEQQLSDFEKDFETTPQKAVDFALLHVILIATAYAIQAMKAAKLNPQSLHSADAWRYATDAKYWQGVANATWGVKKGGSDSGSAFALKGADARHAQHRAYREKAIAAYQSGTYKSKNHAAAEIAGKVVPLTYQVVRDYLKGI